MARWWIGVAVIAAWAGLAATAHGQYLPTSGTGGPAAEPLPCATPYPGGPGPAYGPGPGPVCPPGGQKQSLQDMFTLSGRDPNAFGGPECDPCSGPGAYISLGFLGLRRERLGHGAVAFRDPQTIDTGEPPGPFIPQLLNYNDLSPNFNWGPKVTFGYHWGCESLELTAWYLLQNDSFKLVSDPGRVDLPFFNTPLGFEGNNFLWLQADQVRLSLQTAIGNVEGNYRLSNSWNGGGVEWILGVRYLDLQERLGIRTGDDSLTVLPDDPFRVATYSVRAHNRILAPQAGFEGSWQLLRWLAVSGLAKGAWGANFLEVDHNLTRGDGFPGEPGHRTATVFSQIYEMGFFGDILINPQIRMRAGYNLMWVCGVAEAVEQVDFDLANVNGRVRNQGCIFYHGPSFELQLIF